VSGGERTSGGATGNGEPRTQSTWSAGERTTAAIERESAADSPSARSSRRRNQKRLNVVLLTLKACPVSFDAQRIVRFDSALHLKYLDVALSWTLQRPDRLGVAGSQIGLQVS